MWWLVGELESIRRLLGMGGDVLVVIFILSFMLWAVLLERWFYFAAVAPKAMKKGLNAFYKQEFKDFDEAMDFLEKQIAESLQSEEAQEGITAFLEKRPPNWK